MTPDRRPIRGRNEEMTRAAVLVLVLCHACGTGAAPGVARPGGGGAAPAAGRSVSPLSYLTDEFERVFPARVRLARYGAVRLTATAAEPAAKGAGELDTIELGQSPALVVVDTMGERIRVVAEEDEYRLLLWIESTDLHWVVSDTSDLLVAPGEHPAAPPASGIRVRPGLPVVKTEEQGPLAFIRHEDQCVAVSGWLPRALLSRQYVPVEETESAERNLVAGAGTILRDRPGGRELTRFSSDCGLLSVGRAEAGHQPVVYQGASFEVRGWVTSAPAGTGGGRLFGYGGGMGGFLTGERVLIPAGTCLFSGRGGDVVGMVIDDAEETAAEDVDGGWMALSVSTSWGDLPLWVEKAAGRSEDRAEEVGEVDEESGLFRPNKVKQLALRRCR
jgi:hypothetical protein